jgi:hypothetical protein
VDVAPLRLRFLTTRIVRIVANNRKPPPAAIMIMYVVDRGPLLSWSEFTGVLPVATMVAVVAGTVLDDADPVIADGAVVEGSCFCTSTTSTGARHVLTSWAAAVRVPVPLIKNTIELPL